MNIIFNGLNELLKYIFNFTGDLGISIVLITILIKVAFLPMTIKQKKNMNESQKVQFKIEELKEKYKDNEEKLKIELEKCYRESAKGFLGCFASLIQIPIIFSLYKLVLNLPVQAATIILPWIKNIKNSDPYFILPILYVISTLVSGIYINSKNKGSKSQGNSAMIMMVANCVIGIMITIKAPAAVSIYLLVSSLFTLVEEIVANLCINKAKLA